MKRISKGATFHYLTVIQKAGKINNKTSWLCKCKCGNERTISAKALKSGEATNCGCLYKNETIDNSNKTVKELIGSQINRLKVLDVLPRRYKNSIYFLCRCDCGQELEVSGNGLVTGRIKSCGNCDIHLKTVCKLGHKLDEWGGRSPGGSCKACAKEKSLMRRYGITLLDYLELWHFQNGKCAICKRKLNKGIGVIGPHGASLGRPEVDHQHVKKGVNKKYVRGILCGGRWAGCNRKLGRIDNLDWLQSVITYLQNPPAKQCFGS